MKGRTKSAPSFDSTGYDMASFGGRIPFVFVSFAKGCCDAWLFVRVLSVGGNRVAYSGVKDVFSGQVRVGGLHIQDSVFVFALLEEVEVFGRVDIFLNEFWYDSLNSGVQPGLLAK